MLQSKALAAEDMRWRWGLRTVIIGSNLSTFDIAIDDPELLRGRTVAQNIALLALSNFAERGVGRRRRVVALGPLIIIMAVGTICLECI